MLNAFKQYSPKNPSEPDRISYVESFLCVQPLMISALLRSLIFLHFANLHKHSKWSSIIDHGVYFAPFALISFEDIIGKRYLYWILAYALLVFLLLLLKMYSFRKPPPSPILPVTASPASRPKSMDSASSLVRQYRGLVYVATVMCILGRDLRGFRVSYSKAFYRGTGLMDVGIGSFLFIMGLTGPTARTRPQDFNREKYKSAIQSAIKWTVVLLSIGIIKVEIEQKTNHLPNPIEYGAYWNVFITLGVIKMIGTTLELLMHHRIPPALLALVISGIMEVFQAQGLKSYVFYADRKGFFSSNREGIVQLAGLLALYLWGLHIGRYLFSVLSLPSKCSRFSEKPSFKFFIVLSGNFLFSTLLGCVLKTVKWVEIESRCLANFAYVLWMVAFSTWLLLLILIVNMAVNWIQQRSLSLRGSSEEDSVIIRIDRSGFVFFLIGNILTGLIGAPITPVSKFLKEHIRNAWYSLGIMLAYCSLTTVLSQRLRLPPWFQR